MVHGGHSNLNCTSIDDLAIPLEDWRQFMGNCNIDQYKASSVRGQNNRGKQVLPSCIGRRLGVVVRHMMATERGVLDSEISRPESYMVMHTTKHKIPQCPELFGLCRGGFADGEKARVLMESLAYLLIFPSSQHVTLAGFPATFSERVCWGYNKGTCTVQFVLVITASISLCSWLLLQD